MFKNIEELKKMNVAEIATYCKKVEVAENFDELEYCDWCAEVLSEVLKEKGISDEEFANACKEEAEIDIQGIVSEEEISTEKNFFFVIGVLTEYISNKIDSVSFRQNIEFNLCFAERNKKIIIDYVSKNPDVITCSDIKMQFEKMCRYTPTSYKRHNFYKTGLDSWYMIGFVCSNKVGGHHEH